MRTDTGAMDGYPIRGVLGIYGYYWLDQLCRKMYCDFSFLTYIATASGILCMKTPVRFMFGGGRFVWEAPRRYLFAFIASFCIATIWITVMQGHATVHGHFVPRQYFVPMVFAAILVGKCIRRVRENEGLPADHVASAT